MSLHTPLQLGIHEYEVKNTLKRWLKTNPDSSQDQQSNWKLQKADKTCWTDGKTPTSPSQCPNKPYRCCGCSQGLVSRRGITVLRIARDPYQAMLSPARRGRGSMGCLGRWSAIKSWVNIQNLRTDQRDSQTSNRNDRKSQWAQCPHYPTSHCSLADTTQHCICRMIRNAQSMNAVHHHDQTVLSSKQPLAVWHSQVPEQQPRLWDWIKLAPQSNQTDTKVLGESQKQRRL